MEIKFRKQYFKCAGNSKAWSFHSFISFLFTYIILCSERQRNKIRASPKQTKINDYFKSLQKRKIDEITDVWRVIEIEAAEQCSQILMKSFLEGSVLNFNQCMYVFIVIASKTWVHQGPSASYSEEEQMGRCNGWRERGSRCSAEKGTKTKFQPEKRRDGKESITFLTKISILSAPCGWEQNFKMGFLIKKEAICPRAY